MVYVIREAAEKDIHDILSIYSVYVLETTYTFEYDVPSFDSFQERFRSVTKQFPWIVCEVDGEIAGYAYASTAFERIAYQWDADVAIYLSDKFHRKGIATALYSCLIEILRLQGYYNLYALITEQNEASILFHRVFGFSDIGIFHKTGYKMGAWLDVLWMEKNIHPYDDEPAAPVSVHELGEGILTAICNSHCFS